MIRIISLVLILCNLAIIPVIASERCTDGNPNPPNRGKCTGR